MAKESNSLKYVLAITVGLAIGVAVGMLYADRGKDSRHTAPPGLSVISSSEKDYSLVSEHLPNGSVYYLVIAGHPGFHVEIEKDGKQFGSWDKGDRILAFRVWREETQPVHVSRTINVRVRTNLAGDSVSIGKDEYDLSKGNLLYARFNERGRAVVHQFAGDLYVGETASAIFGRLVENLPEDTRLSAAYQRFENPGAE